MNSRYIEQGFILLLLMTLLSGCTDKAYGVYEVGYVVTETSDVLLIQIADGSTIRVYTNRDTNRVIATIEHHKHETVSISQNNDSGRDSLVLLVGNPEVSAWALAVTRDQNGESEKTSVRHMPSPEVSYVDINSDGTFDTKHMGIPAKCQALIDDVWVPLEECPDFEQRTSEFTVSILDSGKSAVFTDGQWRLVRERYPQYP